MMTIHAYFNIWCEARAGWAVFMKRRTAVHKISSLPEASSQQLAQFDDVCAICYQVNIDYEMILSLVANFNLIFSIRRLGNDIS